MSVTLANNFSYLNIVVWMSLKTGITRAKGYEPSYDSLKILATLAGWLSGLSAGLRAKGHQFDSQLGYVPGCSPGPR